MTARGMDFLGRGWSFPVEAHGDAIRSSSEEEKIRQSIWIILATAPGERAMRPDFGCGIHRLVFELSDASTASRAREDVRSALVRWEPRIDVLDVTAEPRGAGELLLIDVRYVVRTTNNLFNLVFPFYLAGSDL
jgi:uncharacterized protein